tara:strand:+ start:16539 stop:17321 length:783 start_codon:yes stop_codon:yes gene_type:complete
MDVNKNSYTFSFAAIMVVLIAALLSISYIFLKPFQTKNVELEKKQNILKSVGVNIDRNNSENEYSKYITQELVINQEGDVLEGSAFDIDLSKELKKEVSNQKLPLYISKVNNETKYIIPLIGKGLWGPIWGFISLNEDLNTVFAAVFDHKSETPGLGAEINSYEIFQKNFEGKTIMEGDKFVSIVVQKGGSNGDIHKVDGISGGTITSDGVTDMLKERLEKYIKYFNIISNENKVDKMLKIVQIDEDADTISNVSKRLID